MASEQVWVVAACFNEAAVISTFLERVTALPDVDHLLLIDDGSSDATVAVIRDWQRSHPNQAVTLLELTRNFGKEAAMLAGLDYANGRCAAAVLIGSDLQHPPERNPAIGLTGLRLIHGPSSGMLKRTAAAVPPTRA